VKHFIVLSIRQSAPYMINFLIQ